MRINSRLVIRAKAGIQKGSGACLSLMSGRTMDFWTRLDTLLAEHEVYIDRPKGSAHPRYPALVYPLDYGYLKSTAGGDGSEIDVWRGSDGSGRLVAVICTVDLTKNDAEVKLIVGCTDAEIEMIDKFHNKGNMSGITIRRISQ